MKHLRQSPRLTVINVTVIAALAVLAISAFPAATAAKSSVDQDFWGWRMWDRTDGYPDWPGQWTKGNLGDGYKQWQEGDWVSYVLVLNGYGGTVLPEFDIVFDFLQPNSDGILADLTRNWSYKISEPYGGSGYPDDVDPANFTTWRDDTFTPTIINEPFPPGTPDDQYNPGKFAYWRLAPNSAFDDPVQAGQSVVIYFEMHLAETLVWAAGDESMYAAGQYAAWGGDRYDGWTATHLGASYVTGSSGHLRLSSEGVGHKTIPIPVAMRPVCVPEPPCPAESSCACDLPCLCKLACAS